MADIDLKAATPDTSLPSTGFLFGADSQSAASPSVYSTQAVATALLGSTSLTGATVTADSPVLNLAQTWNNAAVAFTGLKFNVPTDSSAAGSLLMDLQVGGSSKFSIDKLGNARTNDGLRTAVAYGGASRGNTGLFFADAGLSARFAVNGAVSGLFAASDFVLASGVSCAWASGALSGAYTSDLFLTRRGTANLRLGAADAAAPVAQTLSVQSVVAGTTNTAGANLTITGSQGTGTGAGGSIVFQVAPAGSSGTAQNALVDALTILGTGDTRVAYNRALDGDGNWAFQGVFNGSLILHSSYSLAWAPGSATKTSSKTLILAQDAANTLALRNGANAQFLRVYSTYTDASNYERGAINTGADFVELAAETAGTGDDNLDVRLTPAGTGNVRFGTHTGTADTAVSGYIEIKDAGGTIRKLAVIT